MDPKIPAVDILIITALREEFAALKRVFDVEAGHSSEHAPLEYYFGSVINSSNGSLISIAVTCLFGMGNPKAGSLATNAIRDLNPSVIIMFGIAGGIKERIPLGGVIVPTRIFYYEQAKLKPDKNEIRPQSFNVDPYLKNKLESFAEKASKPYPVKFGPFAIGEKIVADSSVVERLKEIEPKVLGIEMESFGVAVAASLAFKRPRFITVRGISDHADEAKDDSARQIALNNAADFLSSFLQSEDLRFDKTESQEQTEHLIALHHLSLDQRASIQSSIITSLPEYCDWVIKEIFVDQTVYYSNGILKEPGQAFILQKEFVNTLDIISQDIPDARIGYFGLAHIPLIFHLGYEINRREIQVFATNRQSGHWIKLSDQSSNFPKLIIENLPESTNLDISEVIIKMSISYPVLDAQLGPVIDLNSIPIISISLDEPKPDIITSEEQLEAYAGYFQRIIADMRKSFPNLEKCHLFFSGPPTLAFRCGQQISKTVDPDVIVYNFSNKDNPNYGWSLNIQRGEITDFRKEI